MSSLSHKNGVIVTDIGNRFKTFASVSSGIRTGAIAPGSAKLTRKPRDRPGSRITSQRLEAARRWMHRRENPLCDLEGPRAGCSRDSASVHAESERSRAKARPFSLRVSPTAALPQGSLHRNGGELGLMLTRRYGVTLRAKGFKQPRQACSDELQPA
jgi:hypothetical protein